MAFVSRVVLSLVAVASPCAGLATQRRQTAAPESALAGFVRQRQYAMRRAHLHPKVAPTAMLRAHAKFDDEVALGLTGEALGQAASLSESGYLKVAQAKSREAMEAFVDRVLDQEGLTVTKPADLQGVLAFYDGECATQSFENLIKELRDGTTQHGCREAWVASKGTALLQGEIQTSEVRRVSFNVSSEGAFAPLNEEGYQAVAARKSNAEMSTFVQRVMNRDGLRVSNMDALAGFVPYYSGECDTQSFEALVADIHCVGPAEVTANVTYQFSTEESPSVDEIRKAIAAAAGVDESLIVISEVSDAVDDSAELHQGTPEASETLAVAPAEQPEKTVAHRPEQPEKKVAHEPESTVSQTVDTDEKHVATLNKLDKEPSQEEKKQPEKISKTVKASITTEDSSALKNIRAAMKDISSLEAHFAAFDADVSVQVTPDFDVVSVTPASCGGGWVTTK